MLMPEGILIDGKILLLFSVIVFPVVELNELFKFDQSENTGNDFPVSTILAAIGFPATYSVLTAVIGFGTEGFCSKTFGV